jgi:hypothetical protein
LNYKNSLSHSKLVPTKSERCGRLQALLNAGDAQVVAAGRVQTLLNVVDAQAVAAGRSHAMKAGRAQSLLAPSTLRS